MKKMFESFVLMGFVATGCCQSNAVSKSNLAEKWARINDSYVTQVALIAKSSASNKVDVIEKFRRLQNVITEQQRCWINYLLVKAPNLVATQSGKDPWVCGSPDGDSSDKVPGYEEAGQECKRLMDELGAQIIECRTFWRAAINTEQGKKAALERDARLNVIVEEIEQFKRRGW